jgi:hypothetical protein
MDSHKQILQYLQTELSVRQTMNVHFQKGWKYKTIGDFVMSNGAFYSKICEKKYRRGTIKECFRNTFKLVENNKDLTYVEGFAITENIPLAIMHAWAVNSKGEVIETTWKTPGSGYLGVPFNLNYVREITLKRGKWGVIDNWENGWPLLTEKHIYKDLNKYIRYI